jgi:hypothetical protein
MENSTIRVVLALSSEAGRAALRALLLDQLGIWQIEEVIDPNSAAIRVAAFEPDLLLFDDRMLANPQVRTMLGTLSSRRPHHMVLITVGSRAAKAAALQYVVAVEYLDAPCVAVMDTLRAHLGEPKRTQRRLALVPDIVEYHNFSSTSVAPREPLSRTRSADLSSARPSSETSTRYPSPAARQLAALLHTLLDLPTPPGGDRNASWETPLFAEALRALPRANAPATVLVLELWPRFVPNHPIPPAPLGQALRAVHTGLQDVVRRDDLVCCLASRTFAILLPGVSAHQGAGPLQRLRAALELLRRTGGDALSQSSPSLGMGFWEPGMTPIAPFEKAWQAMLESRTGMAERYV